MYRYIFESVYILSLPLINLFAVIHYSLFKTSVVEILVSIVTLSRPVIFGSYHTSFVFVPARHFEFVTLWFSNLYRRRKDLEQVPERSAEPCIRSWSVKSHFADHAGADLREGLAWGVVCRCVKCTSVRWAQLSAENTGVYGTVSPRQTYIMELLVTHGYTGRDTTYH